MAKISREKWKTYGNVFDQFTLFNLHKLEGQGHFDEFLGPISMGKEANVFYAAKDDYLVAVKIYRLENCDFNKMFDYIKYDPRYIGLKKQKRKVVFSWTQREYRNLLKMREKIRVPKPITFKDNILILEHIGDDAAAPKLKDADIEDMDSFYRKTIQYMKNMYELGFVHGDLSEYNILVDDDEPVFIDMSQSCPLDSPFSEEWLDRDIKNICRFFSKQKIECQEGQIKQFIIGKLDKL